MVERIENWFEENKHILAWYTLGILIGYTIGQKKIVVRVKERK